ncbi:MAG: N-acetylmuramoyl-L-alanine amidase [Candidatus Pelethousia sp.]|nr:N-acetylmuramoyl-L-alanine amidase [Candidatus Pelethousia sp.]
MSKLRGLPFTHMLDTLSIVSLVLLLTFAALPLYSTQIPQEGAQPAVADSGEPQAGYTVVLDAGHGGVDGGAVGSKTGVVEAGLNLTMVKLVQAGLEERGVCVLLTRTDDDALAKGKKADMQARKKVMNQPGVDIVVSIHMNKFTDSSVKGPMAFYMKGSEEGRRLAELVITSVCEAVGSPARKANPADYFMIRESPLPSVLIECGFLSNTADEALLQDPQYQRTLAEGVVMGVMSFLESRPAPQEGLPAPSPSPSPQAAPK